MSVITNFCGGERRSDARTNQTRLVNALVAARRQELSATVRAIETARDDNHNGRHSA